MAGKIAGTILLVTLATGLGVLGALKLTVTPPLAVDPSGTVLVPVDHKLMIAEATVMLRSEVSQPVRVLGVTLPCTCMSFGPIPCTVRPNESVEMNLKIDLEKLDLPQEDLRAGKVEEQLEIFTDAPEGSVFLKIRLVDE